MATLRGGTERIAGTQAEMDIHELEESLARLPSVTAVRVTGTDEAIDEVHVLAAPDRAPRQVARDVQTLALARFGVTIDRTAISVVQVGTHPASDEDRPAIMGVHEIPEGTRTTVVVTLGWRGEEYVGSAKGPAGASARLRLVGEAALRAIESLLGGDALALDAIGHPAIGMRTVIVAVVVASGERGEEVSVGSAISSGDDSETAVRAVLDALNRRIGRP